MRLLPLVLLILFCVLIQEGECKLISRGGYSVGEACISGYGISIGCGLHRLHGEPCSSDSQCMSRSCQGGSYLAVPAGASCLSADISSSSSSGSGSAALKIRGNPCERGFYCRRESGQESHGICRAVLEVGASCDVFLDGADGGCGGFGLCDGGVCRSLLLGKAGSFCSSSLVCTSSLGCRYPLLDNNNNNNTSTNNNEASYSYAAISLANTGKNVQRSCQKSPLGSECVGKVDCGRAAKCQVSTISGKKECTKTSSPECIFQTRQLEKCITKNKCTIGQGGPPKIKNTCMNSCEKQIQRFACCALLPTQDGIDIVYKCAKYDTAYTVTTVFSLVLMLITTLLFRHKIYTGLKNPKQQND